MLSDRSVAKLPIPESGQQFVWDTKENRFGVRITATGVKSWIVQGKIHGKSRRVTLGRCDRLPIKYTDDNGKPNGARHRAREMLLDMDNGIDPRDVKRQKLEASKKTAAEQITVKEAFFEYAANKTTRHGHPLRADTKKQIEYCVTGKQSSFIDWADVPIASLDTDMCREKFNAISNAEHSTDKSKKTVAKANRDFRYLRAVINRVRAMAVTNKGEYPILTINPVTQLFSKDGTENWKHVGKRKNKIPEDKIGAVFNLLEQHANQSEH